MNQKETLTARSRGSHSCSVAHVTPFGIFPNLDTIHKVEYYSTPRNLKKKMTFWSYSLE